MLSDEIFPPEPETAPQIKLKPRKKPTKPAQGDQAAATDPAATTPADPATAASTDPTATDPTATEPAVTETDPTTATTDPTITEPTTETTSDSSVEVTSTDDPTTTTEPVIEPTIDTPADTSVEEPVITSPTEDTPTTTVEEPSTDIVDNSVTTDPDASITDQILQDLEKQAKTSEPTNTKKEYVAPPDYEYKGRGLVYNCQGLHWACIDAPSYKTCEDNASSVKYLKKKAECHPFNVYETTKGCENMQARMVTSAAKTGFCSE